MSTNFAPHLLGALVAGVALLSAVAPGYAAPPIADGAGSQPSVVRLAQSDAYRPPQTYDGYGSSNTYRPGDGQSGGYGDRAGAPPRGGDTAGGYNSGGYNSGAAGDGYRQPAGSGRVDDAYRPPGGGGYDGGGGNAYRPPSGGYDDRGVPPSNSYGEPYAPPREQALRRDDGRDYYEDRGPRRLDDYDGRGEDRNTYSQNEIVAAGHGFFGSISKGLASVIEHAFKKAGRPNGYILGDDAGGAFVAGLRYGEGHLHTKNAGSHKVYWQGPSIGYDFGGAGAKTMVLVYNLRDPSDVFTRFGGIEGTAYLVGGVSIQFLKNEDITMAPIRAGVGLRLGANIGYLKYTRTPTWNPF